MHTYIGMYVGTVQLSCNLTHVRGLQVEILWVNLHDVLQTGVSTRFACVSQPGHKWCPFPDTSFLNTLILTIIQATDAALFIHSSLNPRMSP